MGMFSSLFGSTGSDKADKLRQEAYDAFDAIKTPELSSLQVQLQNYVDAGQLTPEQAEATLINSNAFNAIKTDPSYTGAAKQALQQMQDVANQGGMTAIDKAQLQDIENQENEQRNAQDQAIMQNAKARGVGGSGLETVNRLINQQNASNSANQAGTSVAANAEQRALQAMQQAGGLGTQLENQAYGEEANKAAAENAINQFNAQTANATNLFNTQTANQAQAANLANKQNTANLNTSTQNAGTEYNAQQNQTLFNDALQKAQGEAGVLSNWANQANSDANKEQAGNLALTSGALGIGATALGGAFGGPAGGAAANAATSNTVPNGYMPKTNNSLSLYSEGGMVEDEPSLEDAYNSFTKKYCYGGKINMADGGEVHVKPSKQNNQNKATPPLPIAPDDQNPGEFQIKDPNGQPIGSFEHYAEAAQYADKVREKQPHEKDFRKGGQVPGIAKLPGNNIMNDTVKAKLSPGEVVLPRTAVAHPQSIPNFVNKAITHNPTELALKRLRNAKVDFPRQS